MIEPALPPGHAQAAASIGVQDLAEVGSPIGGGRDGVPLSLTAPVECFTLDTRPGATDIALGRARRTGWRFLVQDEGAPVAVSEVLVSGGGSTFSQLDPESSAQRMAAALATIADAVGSRPDSYQVRFLRVPALNIVALWVASSSGGAGSDVVLPLIAPGGETGVIVDANAFARDLEDRARQAMPPPEAPMGGGPDAALPRTVPPSSPLGS